MEDAKRHLIENYVDEDYNPDEHGLFSNSGEAFKTNYKLSKNERIITTYHDNEGVAKYMITCINGDYILYGLEKTKMNKISKMNDPSKIEEKYIVPFYEKIRKKKKSKIK